MHPTHLNENITFLFLTVCMSTNNCQCYVCSCSPTLVFFRTHCLLLLADFHNHRIYSYLRPRHNECTILCCSVKRLYPALVYLFWHPVWKRGLSIKISTCLTLPHRMITLMWFSRSLYRWRNFVVQVYPRSPGQLPHWDIMCNIQHHDPVFHSNFMKCN